MPDIASILGALSPHWRQEREEIDHGQTSGYQHRACNVSIKYVFLFKDFRNIPARVKRILRKKPFFQPPPGNVLLHRHDYQGATPHGWQGVAVACGPQ
ncbi:hypothetical protein [Novacetimonas cocois]|uniref:hypothetical protein n=1 Tax=Novacetimonas cocois TaxID=1747507 RepID=UPI001057DEFA|nr:hypothetical protein [Novacetimonas cocois]